MIDETKMQQIIDKTCWRAWDGLLPAIFFEVGEKIDEKTGEFSLCLDTCPWQIFENETVLVDSKASKKEIDLVLSKFIGQKVREINVNNQEFSSLIRFDDLTIKVFLNSDQDEWYLLKSGKNELVISQKTLLD